ncbi:MAG: MarR family winged helix-turn-helix transcriptional regulator [Clostridia bacterium]|jgi:DNA-binding MarR family transcriptional regulator
MEEISKGIRVVKLLKQVMNGIKANAEHHFKEMGLSGTQAMLMGVLSHYGKMRISDLSQVLEISNSTVSGIVDRLENQELVQRIRGEKDRRVVYVTVTSKYHQITREHIEKIDRKFEAWFNQATPEELKKILEGLNILAELLERLKR